MPAAEKSIHPLIIGGGYAGLAAALELSRRGMPFTLIEANNELGGQSRTFEDDGFRFDLGPHIFFRQDPIVNDLWDSLMPSGFESHKRSSLLYYRGQLIHSPLKPFNAFVRIGPLKVLYALSSFALSLFRSKSKTADCESWVRTRYGDALFEMFFKTYNEKLWGLPCSQISSVWPSRRIKASLLKMLLKAFTTDARFSLKTFSYPQGGSSQMLRAFEKVARESSGEIRTNTRIEKIRHDGNFNVSSVVFSDGNEASKFTHIISTMSLRDLIQLFDPPVPKDLLDAAKELRFRSLINANLKIRKSDYFGGDAHWIDVHDPEYRLLRLTNYSAFGSDMAPDGYVSVSVEYVCNFSDEVWALSDDQVLSLAKLELKKMGLLRNDADPSGFVTRCKEAYPMCQVGFEEPIRKIASYLSNFSRLQTIGRNGLFTYNNMHHSVRTGLMAVENIFGANIDLWQVDTVAAIGSKK